MSGFFGDEDHKRELIAQFREAIMSGQPKLASELVEEYLKFHFQYNEQDALLTECADLLADDSDNAKQVYYALIATELAGKQYLTREVVEHNKEFVSAGMLVAYEEGDWGWDTDRIIEFRVKLLLLYCETTDDQTYALLSLLNTMRDAYDIQSDLFTIKTVLPFVIEQQKKLGYCANINRHFIPSFIENNEDSQLLFFLKNLQDSAVQIPDHDLDDFFGQCIICNSAKCLELLLNVSNQKKLYRRFFDICYKQDSKNVVSVMRALAHSQTSAESMRTALKRYVVREPDFIAMLKVNSYEKLKEFDFADAQYLLAITCQFFAEESRKLLAEVILTETDLTLDVDPAYRIRVVQDLLRSKKLANGLDLDAIRKYLDTFTINDFAHDEAAIATYDACVDIVNKASAQTDPKKRSLYYNLRTGKPRVERGIVPQALAIRKNIVNLIAIFNKLGYDAPLTKHTYKSVRAGVCFGLTVSWLYEQIVEGSTVFAEYLWLASENTSRLLAKFAAEVDTGTVDLEFVKKCDHILQRIISESRVYDFIVPGYESETDSDDSDDEKTHTIAKSLVENLDLKKYDSSAQYALLVHFPIDSKERTVVYYDQSQRLSLKDITTSEIENFRFTFSCVVDGKVRHHACGLHKDTQTGEYLFYDPNGPGDDAPYFQIPRISALRLVNFIQDYMTANAFYKVSVYPFVLVEPQLSAKASLKN